MASKTPNMDRYIKKEMSLESKNVNLKTGEITGLSSVFNDIDQVGDILMNGSFTKTLSEGGADRPLLWSHKHDTPIGLATHKESEKALELSGLISKEVQKGRETLALLSMKAIKGISIGFEILQDKWNDKGHRQIIETKLWESSIVTFPCLLSAEVTAVKHMKQLASKDFLNFLDTLSRSEVEVKKNEDFLKDAQEKIHAILFSMSEEKGSVLFDNPDFDLTDKESANMEAGQDALLDLIKSLKGS